MGSDLLPNFCAKLSADKKHVTEKGLFILVGLSPCHKDMEKFED